MVNTLLAAATAAAAADILSIKPTTTNNNTTTTAADSAPSMKGAISAANFNADSNLDALPVITSIPSGTSVPKLLRQLAADSEDGEPFYIIDVGQVARQHDQWVAALPRVEPFYAMKCNGDKTILKLLAKLGTGFDCASKAEMETVLKMGVSPDRVIYAHPCKMASHVKYAAQHGVKLMTFDNEHELHKMKELYPNARLVLRVLTDNSRSVCNLGLKFGAALARVPHMLQLAKDLELDVCGVSYHVGSGCFDAQAFADAVAVAKAVFNIGAELGFKFNFLDLGGGFPGSDNATVRFDEIAAVLRVALDKHFPAADHPGLQIIAEPGRYFVSASHTLAVNVVAKRTIVMPSANTAAGTNDANSSANLAAMASASACPATAAAAAIASARGGPGDGTPSFMYYVNDGVYGSFNCILFDHAEVTPRVLISGNLGIVTMDSDSDSDSDNGRGAESGFACSIWGPTCDSMDCLTKTARLPELAIGDWLYFEDMGAYTVAASSTFNGFPKPKLLYVNSESHRDLF